MSDMIDLDKAYTVDELLNMKIADYRKIEDTIDKCFKSIMNKEEDEVLTKAEEIVNAPYHMALNPAFYDIDRQEEAIQREIEIRETLEKASEISNHIRDRVPYNLFETARSLHRIHQNRKNG